MRTRSSARLTSLADVPVSEAWRLSESELWLPDDVIEKIATIYLERSNVLASRLAVARLSSVCKAWDAALLPLFHPGVPGVISPAELRKLKRLALDQANCPPHPHPAPAEAGHSRSQEEGRPGFLLPERMLAAADFGPGLRTALTEGLWFRVREYLRVPVDHSPGQIVFLHLRFPFPEQLMRCTDELLDGLLRFDLYSRAGDAAAPPSHEAVAHFTNTVCTAYRILMVIKAVEARAMALGESEVSRETLSSCVSKDTGEVSLAGWRNPSPAGMLGQLAWDVHRESSASYRRMSRSLLAGSGASSLPAPAAESQDLLLRSFNLPELEAARFPQGIAEDLIRKARQLFPLAFPEMDPLDRTPMVGDRASQSCFAARFSFLFRAEGVSDLQAALGSTMHDLFGFLMDDDMRDDDGDDEDVDFLQHDLGSDYDEHDIHHHYYDEDVYFENGYFVHSDSEPDSDYYDEDYHDGMFMSYA